MLSARFSNRGNSADGENGGITTLPPRVAPAAAPPASKPVPPAALTPPNPELEAALTALDVEYEQQLAELKAKFAERKAALIESHANGANGSGNGAAPAATEVS